MFSHWHRLDTFAKAVAMAAALNALPAQQHTTAQAWHVENYGDRQVNCGKHNETQLTQATQSIEAQSGCANGSGEGQQVCTAVDEADQHNC